MPQKSYFTLDLKITGYILEGKASSEEVTSHLGSEDLFKYSPMTLETSKYLGPVEVKEMTLLGVLLSRRMLPVPLQWLSNFCGELQRIALPPAWDENHQWRAEMKTMQMHHPLKSFTEEEIKSSISDHR